MDGRYLSPCEAAWRIEGFPLCGRSHAVTKLSVHTENQQKLIFEENHEEDSLKNWETSLTAWFDLNKNDEFARKIHYVNIPQYYILQGKKWIRRKNVKQNEAIGRLIITVSPKDEEKFYLKLLLRKITGATSFDDLKTFNEINYETYKDTALAMGLIKNDKEIEYIFEEAVTVMLPKKIKTIFCMVFVN